MKNIVFIGMPASGKSTVGVVVAKRLGFEFIDTDLLIQKQEKKLLCEIIEHQGLEEFHRIENQVNKDLLVDRAVIAPGGSVVYCQEAMEHFKKIATVVYLQVPFEDIQKRLKNIKQRGVSIKEGQTLRNLYDERVELFEKYADVTISEENSDLEDTIEKVLDVLEKRFYKTATTVI